MCKVGAGQYDPAPMILLPSIDLRDGKVVRLKQGDYARQITYDVDPLVTACSFRVAGAAWMHLVDLDGARDGAVRQADLIARIIEAGGGGMKVECGGGVRSTGDVERLLSAGASRVVVGTRAIEAWDWFNDLVHDPAFAGKIVLALDAKEGVVATRGWTHESGRRAVEVAREVSDWPLAGILYTDVARDGMLSGPNFEQTRQLTEAGRVAVIASGGVGSLDHVRRLTTLSVWGAVVGRSLYEGTIDLREAVAVAGPQS